MTIITDYGQSATLSQPIYIEVIDPVVLPTVILQTDTDASWHVTHEGLTNAVLTDASGPIV